VSPVRRRTGSRLAAVDLGPLGPLGPRESVDQYPAIRQERQAL
jgi:hypothetical protein